MPDKTTPADSNESHSSSEDILRAAARLGDSPLDIAEVALAFAAMDRPGVPIDRYRRELEAMNQTIASYLEALSGDEAPAERVGCITKVLAEDLSFAGDTATYDDPQNANLMRVMDRRKGLPVALGILYIHAARGQGWWAEGLNFPNHFLIRVRDGVDQVILDPFHAGRSMDAPALRELIQEMSRGKGELTPEATAAVPDRHVLLRLQNNIKLRLYRNERFTEALAVLERMRMLAPDLGPLTRETGMVNARIGNLRAAITLLKSYLEDGGGGADQHETAIVLRDLEKRLN
jgi:regulator of sirC expression with transglutaminase-like and TPR domain